MVSPSLKAGRRLLVCVQGGVQVNVVPSEMAAYFDMRVTPHADLEELDALIASWCRQAGGRVRHEFLQKLESKALTSVTKGDRWWDAFASALDSM